METQPVHRIEDHQSGETPEDVAILYSWANLQGAKYRDFSAIRREYRAQMRHRAAEQLRLMELKAQSEAEAAAAEAEAEAAAAHAEADAATARLATSRSIPAIAPEEIRAEKEVEFQRKSSLREAAQQARRAAAERLEAARRAEAAALADSIARREEREIAEAQASALRQAAQYAESDLRSRQMNARQPVNAVPGRISDPYSPQILAEGEYFENPGTPIAELAASRFRNQRDYIERATGVELPSFRMPGGDVERAKVRNALAEDGGERRLPDWFEDEEQIPSRTDFSPRKLSDLNLESRDLRGHDVDLKLGRRVEESANLSVRPKTAAQMPNDDGRIFEDELPARMTSNPHRQQRGTGGNDLNSHRAEIVERLPAADNQPFLYRSDRADYKNDYDGASQQRDSEMFPEASREPRGWPEERVSAAPKSRAAASYDGYPGSNFSGSDFAFASPYTPPQPLRHPEFRPERFSQRGNDLPSVRLQSPMQAPADDYWSEGLNNSQARAANAMHAQPPGNAEPPFDAASNWPEPEWLEAKPTRPAAQNYTQAGSTTLRTEQAESLKQYAGDTLQSSREQVASRWFALKEIFANTGSGRSQEPQAAKDTNKKTPIIAVFSMAGGVGKTSMVATLGRTLSSLGEKVLLTDTTSQGLLPFYFGAKEVMPGAMRTFLPPSGSTAAPIHLVSYSTDLHSDKKSQGEIVEDLLTNSQRAHRVLLDVNVNCRWLVERLARLQPTVLVPLSANMNSVLSLQSVERTFGSMTDAEGESLRPLYVLNQFDPSLPLHLDVREVLRQQLGDRLLPLVIRQAAGVSEALAEGMTIVDYDPESVAVQDYLGLANWIRSKSAPADVGLRNLRWSER